MRIDTPDRGVRVGWFPRAIVSGLSASLTTLFGFILAYGLAMGAPKVKERRRSWASLYAWQVTRTGGAPLFRQVYMQIRSAILLQNLRPGTKLPHTRFLRHGHLDATNDSEQARIWWTAEPDAGVFVAL